ncbi:MAG: IPT/TIG domain-containing protein [Blastocatellales bacterium]
MKMIPTPIRSTARALLFAALLLMAVSFGLARLGDKVLPDTASAQNTVSVVNAASFATDKVVAPNTIVAAFGTFVTQNNQAYIANALPLPTTLGGVRVTIGNTDCGLFFVASTQINFLIPSNVADGASVQVTVTNSNNTVSNGTFTVVRSAPGIFSAKATGQGSAAAQTTTDGIVLTNTYNPDGTEREVSAGTVAQPNILVLYVTGVRNTPAANPTDVNGVAEAVTVTIQGVSTTVLYAGPAPGFEGLDQINCIIPPELSGLGLVNVRVRANNRDSNIVTLRIGGTIPEVRASPIVFGQTINGALTVTDQVQAGNAGDTFFFDAFTFETTAANTSVAIDMRSNDMDAAVLLYRINGSNLDPIAADDQSGNYGSLPAANNNNALLMTVLQNPGRYAIFATTSDLDPNGIGNYSLKLVGNVATPIAYGQTLNGTFTNTDLQTSAGTYLDLYWFNGVQGDNARMNMNAPVLDSFLLFHANTGDPRIAEDDNSGGGKNAQITNRLSNSGIFIIICTPLDPNVTGDYSVQLTKLTSFDADAGSAWNRFFKAPGRSIPETRQGLVDPYKTSFERMGSRRIIR